MAFYKSKYTGAEIDQRLAQGTYDDALMRGFDGAKEDFDILLAKLKKTSDLALGSQQYEDNRLETVNKTVVDAINELHTELQSKPNKDEVVEQDELQVFKDEIAAKYATKGELEEESTSLNSKITTVNNNLVESVNTINENVNNGFIAINEAIKQNAETLVAEITERKEAITEEATIREESDKELSDKINTVNDNLVNSINSINQNVADGFNTINGGINNEIRPAIEKNTKAIATEISDRQNADIELDSKKLDSDKLLSGAGINIREEDGKKIVDIAEDALTKIQYSDSEVRRLETAKIPYAYDEKTQSNINVILPEGGSYLGNYGDENATIAKAAVYDGIKQLEIGSSKVHTNINSLDKLTIETPDGKETLVVESDIELMPIEVNFPIRTSGGSDGPEDRVYTQEEILEWFGVADIAALKKQIANKGIQYIKYGIILMGNPYYYRMPIQYAAFESANRIKLVFIGLNTNNDVVSKYEIIINLDGTIIKGNSNIKVTITSIEPKVYNDTELRNQLQQTETGVANNITEIEKLQNKITELENRLTTLESK